jgi:tRNA (guanosine-2'-O-)-methyltransferase
VTTERREKVDRVLERRQPDLSVLMDRVRKPHNFSAVIRTCDAAGIHEIHAIAAPGCLPTISHTSQGAENWVRVKRHDNAAQAVAALRERGLKLIAASLSGQAQDFRDYDYTQPTAIALGTEYSGLSAGLLEHVEAEIRVPMLGMTRSFNVSVACAIILFEAQRQRAQAGYFDQRRLSDEDWHNTRFEWLHPKLAEYCRKHGIDYPALDENGDLTEDLPH